MQPPTLSPAGLYLSPVLFPNTDHKYLSSVRIFVHHNPARIPPLSHMQHRSMMIGLLFMFCSLDFIFFYRFRLFFPILLAALSKILRMVGHPRWGDAVRVGDGAPKLV